MRVIMIIQMALLASMAQAATYDDETRPNLAVCLQVETPDPHVVSPMAQGLAARIFAHVGISLEWRACEPAKESARTPIVVELVSGAPEAFRSGVLAYAMPYRRRVVIFFDRIEEMPEPWTVLGHVMAHEITHIIQRVPRHSSAGLMKPRWTSRDFMEMRRNPLSFSEEDLTLLYAALGMRRGWTATPTLAR